MADWTEKYMNKVLHGNCWRLLEGIPDDAVDLIIADPPYGIRYQSHRRAKDRRFPPLKFDTGIFHIWLEHAWRVLKEGGALYLFTRWDVLGAWTARLEKYFSIKNCLIWDRGLHGCGDLEGSYAPRHDEILFCAKGRHILRGNRVPDIMEFQRPYAETLLHPTQKPTALIHLLLEKSSDVGDVVLDPFSGSGTVPAACIEKDRDFIAMELDEDYYTLCCERVEACQAGLSIEDHRRGQLSLFGGTL